MDGKQNVWKLENTLTVRVRGNTDGMNVPVVINFLPQSKCTNPYKAANQNLCRRDLKMIEEEYRELDLQLGDAQHEINTLRRQLRAALDEAVWLRQQLEGIYALSNLALYAGKSERIDESRADAAETEQN